MRRLEVRIGKLLGPAERGGDRRSDQVHREELESDGLSPQQRNAFRQMAENEEEVEAIDSKRPFAVYCLHGTHPGRGLHPSLNR